MANPVAEFMVWFFTVVGFFMFLLPFSVFACAKMGRMGWLLAERHFRLKFPNPTGSPSDGQGS